MSIGEIITTIRALPADQRRRLYAELDDVRSADAVAPEQEPPSAYDLAKDSIGPGSDLGDLSSNPAYLEGYGESAQR